MRIRTNEYEVYAPHEIPKKGFRWVTGGVTDSNTRRRPSGRWLVWASPWGWRLLPDASTDLFMDFSKLDETEAAILDFANREGGLGISAQVAIHEGPLDVGESFDHWVDEIRAMRFACDLVFALKGRNGRVSQQIKEWITINPGEGVTFRADGETRTTLSVHAPDIKKQRWAEAARMVLGKMASERFSQGVRLSALNPKLQLQRTITVESLLAGMWIQLLDACVDDRIRHCEACGERLVLVPGRTRKGRSDRTYCDNEGKCKQLAYRNRTAKTGRK